MRPKRNKAKVGAKTSSAEEDRDLIKAWPRKGRRYKAKVVVRLPVSPWLEQKDLRQGCNVCVRAAC